MKPLFVALAVFSLFACDTDVTQEYSIPYTEQLVLESFISPQDTLIEVRVMKTAPSIGEIDQTGLSNRILTDARVELSNGTRVVTLPFRTFKIGQQVVNGSNEVSGYFLDAREFLIEAGQTYTLRVSTPAGLRAEARCTVPNRNITPTDVEITRGTTRVNGQERPTFSVRVKDQPGVPNYYALTGFRTQISQNPSSPQQGSRYGFLTDYLTDKGRDGEWLSTERYTVYGNLPQPAVTDIFELYLATTDAAYHEYLTTILRNQEAQGNPFAEPQPVYSNVSGGLGVFAAHQWIKLPLAF